MKHSTEVVRSQSFLGQFVLCIRCDYSTITWPSKSTKLNFFCKKKKIAIFSVRDFIVNLQVAIIGLTFVAPFHWPHPINLHPTHEHVAERWAHICYFRGKKNWKLHLHILNVWNAMWNRVQCDAYWMNCYSWSYFTVHFAHRANKLRTRVGTGFQYRWVVKAFVRIDRNMCTVDINASQGKILLPITM